MDKKVAKNWESHKIIRKNRHIVAKICELSENMWKLYKLTV